MPLLKRWPAAQQMIVKLAGRAICLDLGERLLITVTRKFDELFVYPASPMVAPPYHSPNEPTGNRSSRHDYPPEMPGVGPPLVRADGRISFAADRDIRRKLNQALRQKTAGSDKKAAASH